MNTKNTEIMFFTGPEVINTPANSKKTLFVKGKPDVELIDNIARKNFTPHIFLGFQNSFSTDDQLYWDQIITILLDTGFMVTLEYQAHQHQEVLKMLNPGIWQCRLFIPLLNVKIPNIHNSNPNLSIKIDDVEPGQTNDGVWCLHHKEITDSNRLTTWTHFEFENADGYEKIDLNNTISESIKNKVEDNKETVDQIADTDPEIKNDTNAGLDFNPTSALKPETEEETRRVNRVLEKINPEVVADAAELYATVSPDVLEKDTKKSRSKK